MKRKYIIEIIMFLSYVLFAMAWSGGTAFMKEIMTSMGITSLASASLISTSVTFAKIVGTAIAAWTMVKLNIRNAFSIASLMICASILTPYSPNYPILLASRFLMGLGGALMVVYFNPIVIEWFEPHERPLVNGLNAVAFNVGTAIIMFFFSDFEALLGGWKQTLTVFSLLSGLMFLLWLVFGSSQKADTVTQNTKPVTANYRFIDGLKDPFNWKFSLTYAGLLSFYIVLFTFYPRAGISQAKIVILMGIVGAVLGIIYSKKIKKRVPIIRISGLIQLLCVVGLNFSGNNATLATISASILGIFMFLPMTALITLAHEMPGMTPQRASVTFSLFWSISYISATIVPTIFGAIVDANHGSFSMAFVFITCVAASFFIGSFTLPEPSQLKEQQTTISRQSSSQTA